MLRNYKFYKDLAENVIKDQETAEKIAFKRLVPILLGSYSEKPYNEMGAVIKKLGNEGFENAMILKDAPTSKYFNGSNQNKFFNLFNHLLESGYLPLPIFYFSNPEEEDGGKGLGHHGELLDIINFFPDLLPWCVVFKHPDAKVLDHIRIVHPHKIITVNNFLEYQEKVKEYVKGYLPFVLHLIKMDTRLQQSLLTKDYSIISDKNKGVGKND